MTKFGVAQPVRRVEDPRLLKGAGSYTADYAVPGMLHGVVLRSPHANAKILALDVSAASALPGVRAVYTNEDLKADKIGLLPVLVELDNRDGSKQISPPRHTLAEGQVRHVGEPVAFIVADTLQVARDAAEAVLVDYDILDSVTDLATATHAGMPQVWPTAASNLCFDWEVGPKAETEALFKSAAHVTRLTVVNNRIVVNSMEARACLADYDTAAKTWTIRTNTQGSWTVRNVMAGMVFGLDPSSMRVITPDVGGGFGMKLFLYPEHVLTTYASRKLGHPVRWVSERSEAFLSDSQGRDNITEAELAIDAGGKFLALRTKTLAGMGAYLSNFAPYIPTLAGSGVLASIYGFKTVYANVLGVFTNTVPVDAYRGAGRPEANYVVERIIDAAARELGIDRIELRRRNMVGPEAMPHTSAMGRTYDSGNFPLVMDTALAHTDWAGIAARKAEAAKRGKKRGIGMAYYLEATGGDDTERAEIRFADDGYVDVYVGTQSTGQGHETAYVQLTVDRLGVDGDRVRVKQGDTADMPTGGGTGGARSLYSEGQAIVLTAATVIEKGRRAASEALETAMADIVFEAGRFQVVGTDRGIDIIALALGQRARAAKGEDVTTLDAAEVAQITHHTFPNGCHIAEVEIDPETGRIEVVRYSVTDDVGKAVNPMIVAGQVHGGVAQGLGQALLEHTAYDPDSGQLLAGSLMDYTIPRADDLPNIDVELVEVPCLTNGLGVKGAGEAGAVGAPPALINAILDALADMGVTQIDMPATPEVVWRALAKAA